MTQHQGAGFTAAFDSGRGRLIESLAGDGRARFVATIDHDAGGEFFQWFHFRLGPLAGERAEVRLVGLNASAYPQGWPGYRARMSRDGCRWTQADCRFDPHADGGTLLIDLGCVRGFVWLAYFEPYPLGRHEALVARLGAVAGFAVDTAARSLEGRPVDMLTVGEGSRPVWLYGRQHPGETMAAWWMEGALEALADPGFAAGRILRQHARLHLVPCINPDGAFRGYLRTNAAGANLNREWAAPAEDRSPEVAGVLAAMDRTGVAFALDVHGDEVLPHNFIAGFEGIPSLTTRQSGLLERYRRVLAARAPEFQTEIGYPPAAPGSANLGMSTNQLAERFGCVAGTLEMPFKDSAELPDPVHGWSGARSAALARECLAALAAIIDDL